MSENVNFSLFERPENDILVDMARWSMMFAPSI
jgi:hypothetical protein